MPGARRLHDYANLHICARNPMLYKLQFRTQRLCILSVSLIENAVSALAVLGWMEIEAGKDLVIEDPELA